MQLFAISNPVTQSGIYDFFTIHEIFLVAVFFIENSFSVTFNFQSKYLSNSRNVWWQWVKIKPNEHFTEHIKEVNNEIIEVYEGCTWELRHPSKHWWINSEELEEHNLVKAVPQSSLRKQDWRLVTEATVRPTITLKELQSTLTKSESAPDNPFHELSNWELYRRVTRKKSHMKAQECCFQNDETKNEIMYRASFNASCKVQT